MDDGDELAEMTLSLAPATIDRGRAAEFQELAEKLKNLSLLAAVERSGSPAPSYRCGSHRRTPNFS